MVAPARSMFVCDVLEARDPGATLIRSRTGNPSQRLTPAL
jgi:hypothetical protein